jgi:ABC-type dipeptide/oligopeptide/nickel transport system permease subunit
LIYGSRISLTVAFIATILSVLLGSAVGAAGGFVGGFTDSVLMRIVDGMLAIPTFFLALLILALFGPSLRNVILVIGLTAWMVVARVVRSEVLRAKNEEYVTAATSIGASPFRVLTRHVMPQAFPSLIVAATLGIAYAVIDCSERGMRLEAREDEPLELDQQVKGVLRLRTHPEVAIQGVVVRVNGDTVALRLDGDRRVLSR